MVKTKKGEEISTKEFMKRWAEGCNSLTPEQSNKIQLRGTTITLIGILCGLVISVMNYKLAWWLAIILLGALFNTWVTYAGLRQQKKQFKRMEGQVEETDKDIGSILDELGEELKGGDE